jgi:hypothetical protein
VLLISQTFNGSEYTDCLVENQLVDVLESGRSNVCGFIVKIMFYL